MSEYRDPTPNDFPEDYDKTKVDPRVLKRTKAVREKMYGIDTRNAMSEAEEISSVVAGEAKEVAENTETRQTDLENRYEDQIAGNTDISEVIDARRPNGGNAYPTLNQRLDAEKLVMINEFMERGGVNVKTFGAIGDFVTDDSDAFIDATQNYLKVFVPEGKYLITQNGVDYAVLYGPGRVFRNDKEVFINPDFPREKDLLFTKHRMFAKHTWGTYEDAAVMSVIANEDDPRSQTLGLTSSKHAAQYSGRDSVGQYIHIRGRNPSFVLNDSTIYTSDTVQVPLAVIDNFIEGMIIDTLGSIRYTAIIKSVDYQTGLVTVHDRFYKVGDVDDTTVPTNGDGINLNRVTKIWASNLNVFFPADAETNAGVIAEWGIFNDKSFLDKGGVDLVNFKGKSGWGWRQRKDPGASEGFEYGTMMYNTLFAHTMHQSTLAEARAQYILASFIGNDSNINGFRMDGTGMMNKLKLKAKVVNVNGELYLDDETICVIIISKTVEEEFRIKSPVGRVGEFVIVKNAMASKKVLLKTIDGKSFSVGTYGNTTVNLLQGSSTILVSDGSFWHALTGNFEGSYDSPILTGSAAPTISAQFVGQIYVQNPDGNIYMAKSTGQFQNDWKLLS